MSREHLQRLEWARQEVLQRANSLDERRRKQEIGGIEHKILMHESLFGRDKHEFLEHIDGQIADTKSQIREKTELRIVVALMLVAMAIAFASTIITPEAHTGLAVQESSSPEEILSGCQDNQPAESNSTLQAGCSPENNSMLRANE